MKKGDKITLNQSPYMEGIPLPNGEYWDNSMVLTVVGVNKNGNIEAKHEPYETIIVLPQWVDKVNP